MARLGRTFPIPVRIGGRRTYHQATAELGTFETAWTFPAITVTSPSVSIPLGAFETGWTFPAMIPAIGLDVFETGWEFPALSVVTPVAAGDQITASGQVEWNGFLLGSGTPYRMTQLDGWDDLPAITSGNVPHPSRHGSLSGRKLAEERTITWTGFIRAPRAELEQAVEDLRAATAILEDDTELPLAIRPLSTIYITAGSILRRSISIDKNYRLGLARVVLQWVCSDPRLKGRELNSATIGDGEVQTLTNAGNAASHPLIRCPGPAPGPMLICETLDSTGAVVATRVLEFDLTLADGETLVVDPDLGTATVDDESVMDTLTGSSVPVPDWVLAAGQSDIGYQTIGGGAPPATVLWRHTRL